MVLKFSQPEKSYKRLSTLRNLVTSSKTITPITHKNKQFLKSQGFKVLV